MKRPYSEMGISILLVLAALSHQCFGSTTNGTSRLVGRLTDAWVRCSQCEVREPSQVIHENNMDNQKIYRRMTISVYGKRFLHNKIAQHKTHEWDPLYGSHPMCLVLCICCVILLCTNHNSSVYRWMMLDKHVDDTNETPFFQNGNLNPISINCIVSH
jgi:hypothetical protein